LEGKINLENIGHFLHAWLMFITPLIYLGYKPKFKKQLLFTILYGLGIILFRRIYDFLPVPFGTHMILLVVLHATLLTAILGEVGWMKAIFISLISFVVILINDSIIFVPAMRYLDITINKIGSTNIVTYIILWILSNSLLIVSYIARILKSPKKQSYNL